MRAYQAQCGRSGRSAASSAAISNAVLVGSAPGNVMVRGAAPSMDRFPLTPTLSPMGPRWGEGARPPLPLDSAQIAQLTPDGLLVRALADDNRRASRYFDGQAPLFWHGGISSR